MLELIKYQLIQHLKKSNIECIFVNILKFLFLIIMKVLCSQS